MPCIYFANILVIKHKNYLRLSFIITDTIEATINIIPHIPTIPIIFTIL